MITRCCHGPGWYWSASATYIQNPAPFQGVWNFWRQIWQYGRLFPADEKTSRREAGIYALYPGV